MQLLLMRRLVAVRWRDRRLEARSLVNVERVSSRSQLSPEMKACSHKNDFLNEYPLGTVCAEGNVNIQNPLFAARHAFTCQ
jgi:hypothetical protein